MVLLPFYLFALALAVLFENPPIEIAFQAKMQENQAIFYRKSALRRAAQEINGVCHSHSRLSGW